MSREKPIFTGIAVIEPRRTGKHVARIKFDGYADMVEFYFVGPSKTAVWQQLSKAFPKVKIVKVSELTTEIDFHRLFGCSSDAPSIELPSQ